MLKDYCNVQEGVRRRIMNGLFSDSSGGLKLQRERCRTDCRKMLLTALTPHLETEISRTGCRNFLKGAWGMFDPTPALGRDQRTC